MKNNALIAALTLAGAASAAGAAPPIDFTGYMRAGTGVNSRGGTQVCYGLPGADTKWRLGNECDYVIEPNFAAKLAEFEGASWHVHFMPSVYRAWGGGEFQTSLSAGDQTVTSSGTDELVARFGQVYTYGDKIAALGNGKVWAGRRFYNRLQTGINDQFLENNDGDGAGLEDMSVGVGKLSVAFMMNGRNSAVDNRFQLPIRLTNLPTMKNGELAIYVTPSMQLKTQDQTTGTEAADQPKGLAVGLYHTMTGVVLGGNTLVGFKHDKFGATKNTRVVAQQSAKFGSTTVEGLVEYRVNTQLSNAGNKWFAIGARTDTHISGPFRMLFEAGHDQVKPEDGSATRNMTKFTLAGAISAGADAGSRPTVRLFYTHAMWNEAARLAFSNDRTRQVFGDKHAGDSIGIQGETWW